MQSSVFILIGLCSSILGAIILVKSILLKKIMDFADEVSTPNSAILGPLHELNVSFLKSNVKQRIGAINGLVVLSLGFVFQIVGQFKFNTKLSSIILAVLIVILVIVILYLSEKFRSKKLLRKILLQFHAKYRIPINRESNVSLIREIFEKELPVDDQRWPQCLLDLAKKAGFSIIEIGNK